MTQPTLEQTLLNAARESGKMLREKAFEISKVNWKGKDDPVTDLDLKADQIIANELMKFGGTVISEEHPEWGIDDKPYIWYVDPIDGTKSLLKGQYLSAVSIGVHKNNTPVGAIVYDFMRDIAYVATETELYRMRFETEKKYPFKVQHGLSKKKVLTGDNGIPQEISDYFIQNNYTPERRIGSIALAMAHVAIGTYDAYATGVATRGAFWDVAAGLYLMQRSGLKVIDLQGKMVTPSSHTNGIIATKTEGGPVIKKPSQTEFEDGDHERASNAIRAMRGSIGPY